MPTVKSNGRDVKSMLRLQEHVTGLSFPQDIPPRPKRIDRDTYGGLGNHKNGDKRGRRGLPRARIKPGRSRRLQDAI